MKKMLFIILYLFFMYFILVSSKSKDIMIESIDIVSINWSIKTRIPITESTIWCLANSFKTQIKDTALLKKVENSLTKIGEGSNDDKIDVRISCILNMEDGSKDTLSFGHINKMKLNNYYYPVNKQLLVTIRSLLPDSQQVLIKE